jgi:hypothetical protein
MGEGGEATKEMRAWHERIQSNERRLKEKKLHNKLVELNSQLNLRSITQDDYDAALNNLEEQHKKIQQDVEITDQTLRELSEGNRIERIKEQFNFLVNDWIASLKGANGHIHLEIAGIIAACAASANLNSLFEKQKKIITRHKSMRLFRAGFCGTAVTQKRRKISMSWTKRLRPGKMISRS